MNSDRRFRVAVAQMTSGLDVAANLAQAEALIAEAAGVGASLVVLPENFSFMGADDAARVAVAEPPGEGPAQAFTVEQAGRHGLWLVAGTIPVQHGDGRVNSRSLLVSPAGRVVAHYDKIHLFDVSVPAGAGESYRESATTAAGERVVCADTELARIGMSVCYDIRFPALFDRLGSAGMELLVVPAAFTVPTGRVHWRPLLQARAIESLSFVAAAGQCGEHPGGRRTWGHSMIVGPWGDVLAECAEETGIAHAEVDMIELARLRRQFPALEHRRKLQ